MPQPAAVEPAIGFYTVEQSELTGWTGGLLVLNAGGRPLEFQCTLPIRPTRAHEILFGASLRDYLIGEAVGPLLLSRCRNAPVILCCDQPEALQLDTHGSCPLALVCEAAEGDEGPISDDTLPGFDRIELAGATVRVAAERSEHVRRLAEQLGNLPDLIEPFSRIREAIQEAHKQVARRSVAAAA
jgi:hypothetical protein